MHLHYPHHRNQPRTAATRIQKLLSPPRQHESTKNRTWFSIFYTAATTFPHVSTLIHWAVLMPMHKTTIPGKDTLLNLRRMLILTPGTTADKVIGHDWFTSFFVINKYAISSAIALIETMVYSSIRRQTVSLFYPFLPALANLVSQSLLTLPDSPRSPSCTLPGHTAATSSLESIRTSSWTTRKLVLSRPLAISLASLP